MAWTVDSSGTQTADGLEDILDQPTTNATYVLAVDINNMAAGDITTLRIYDKVDATNYRVVWYSTFANAPLTPGVFSPPIPVTTQGKFTLQQTAGTNRTYPWKVMRT